MSYLALLDLDRFLRVCPIHLELIEFLEEPIVLYNKPIIEEIPTCQKCGPLLYWYVWDTATGRLVIDSGGEPLSGFTDSVEGMGENE